MLVTCCHGHFLLVYTDPLNLPMWYDWVAVHVERFVPIAGGQINSAVSQGCVN